MVQTWECPACGRAFGRTQQTHVCAPAMTVEQYFAARPAWEREVFDAVAAHFAEVGPVHMEPVGVGVLVKRGRTFVELRPKRERLELSVLLEREVDHPRIRRRVSAGARRTAHLIDLRSAADVDEHVRRWLTESYVAADGRARG